MANASPNAQAKGKRSAAFHLSRSGEALAPEDEAQMDTHQDACHGHPCCLRPSRYVDARRGNRTACGQRYSTFRRVVLDRSGIQDIGA